MAKATINFTKCIQDLQELGSNDDYMVSRVFFSLSTPDNIYNDLSADIKQTVGSEFENHPLEVTLPKDFEGKLNYEQFRNAVESYYRNLVGKKGHAIRVNVANKDANKGIRMYNNVMNIRESYEIEITSDGGGW